MTEEKISKINPNVADERSLQELPGIGPSLAKRIVDSRPFYNLDDLKNVRGIGESILERIAPMLEFEESKDRTDVNLEEGVGEIEMPVEQAPIIDAEPVLLSPDGKKDEDLKLSESKDDKEQAKEATVPEEIGKKDEHPPRPEPVKKPRLVRTFSRAETIWLVIAVGALSLILSVGLSMIILGGINGTLDFSQLQSLKQLESDVGVLEEDLMDLSSRLDIFDQRLTPLEGLTGRMTVVEDLAGKLQEEVEDAMASVETMQSDLERLSNETARLSGRVDRFDTFLDGLQRLLNEIFAAPSAEPLPES
jgi:ribosomal protein S13